MELRIKNFRSHFESSWVFDIGGSNYIRGDNGAGKSDIYRAITWCLYGRKFMSDSEVAPVRYPNATTVVEIEYQGISVRRQGNSHSFEVSNGKELLRQAEADAFIATYFGNFDKWQLATYITQTVSHSFIRMKSEGRMAIINSLIGNDEGELVALDKLLRECRAEQTTAEKELYGLEAVHNATYGKSAPVDASMARDRATINSLARAISGSRTRLEILRGEQQQRNSRANELSNTQRFLDQLSDYSAEEYSRLKEDLAICQQHYNNYRSLANNSAEFTKIPPQYSKEDYDAAVIAQHTYEEARATLAKYKIAYNRAALEAHIKRLRLSIEYSQAAKLASVYAAEARKLQNLDAKIITLKRTSNIIDADAFIARAELSLIYQGALVESRRRTVLEEELASLLPPLTPAMLTAYEFSLPNQWILEREEEHSSLVKAIGCEPQLTEWRRALHESTLQHLECPACGVESALCDGRLVPCQQRLDTQSIALLRRRIRAAEAADNAIPPPRPTGFVVIDNIPHAKKQISHTRRRRQIEDELATLPATIDIPEGIEAISDVRRLQQQLKDARELLVLTEERRQLSKYLETLPNPSVPEGVEIVDDDAEALLAKLEAFVWIDPPSLSPSSIERAREWHRLRAVTVDVLEYVDASAVQAYGKKVNSKQRYIESIEVLKEQLAATSDIDKRIEVLSAEIKALEVELNNAERYNAVTKSLATVATGKAKAEAAQRRVAEVREYREARVTFSRELMTNSLHTIKEHANATMKKLMPHDIRIELAESSNKLILNYYKDGLNHGDPEKMSGGEADILSFALVISFNHLTMSKFIILDEATKGIATHRKDSCISHLLEYTESSGKTLMLTDHSCPGGDYSNIIDVIP